ncbi:MAG: chemotaxis response regulator protein-glutamate methylesterase [Desulfobacteraceae bacterium]|uniref:Protein-glutamate methylesterase/protein-glutamine glutaminase n=1 Tax=Candidatus Desulfaltia bathyphila TaxID=2841697 RepID=A0A8J6TAJ6_9BACT|nr:chemotaxis response regulator protein-glutamate methylesterase [Candidatus Desulfaltia bathyphila]MBL7195108.1 chemotaxis response regulator protein-glutamate methylesterase [Desulfobacterales bacterium]
MKPIRVLIIDDSPIVQLSLRRILSKEPDIEVMGVASDPFEAKDLMTEDKPDVITLDIEMLRMDGITFLKRLMSYSPIPVVMISSYTRKNSIRTIEALEAGAVDFVTKPSYGTEIEFTSLRNEIVTKIRGASEAQVKPIILQRKALVKTRETPDTIANKLIAIGASIGGPMAVQKLLCGISFQPPGIVIAQHMAAGYTQAFAQRLNDILPFDVREACDMDRVDQGEVLIIPGGRHMRVVRNEESYMIRLDKTSLTQDPSIDVGRSINVLFHSVAKSAGPNAVGIILTGMGKDGVDGLAAMKGAGAYTIAQDEASCVVFGMPRVAIERGIVDAVASPEDIPAILLTDVK